MPRKKKPLTPPDEQETQLIIDRGRIRCPHPSCSLTQFVRPLVREQRCFGCHKPMVLTFDGDGSAVAVEKGGG